MKKKTSDKEALRSFLDLLNFLKKYSNLARNCPLANQKQQYADVLQNRCSEKFRNIQRKIPVLESLYNKDAGLGCNFIKRDSNTGVFLLVLRNF